MFVLLSGRSKLEAFRVGEEMAEAITKDNPPPVKLKFEKVYFPCVLMSKKRYVGYSYESSTQKEPKFDAKGIETVRRDTCPLVSKTMEKSLHLLFSSSVSAKGADVGVVASYVGRQMRKVAAERIPLHEFVFVKQYRGADGYRPGAVVPSLTIARDRVRTDGAWAAPRCKERVAYVIVAGDPGARLISCVREPQRLLDDPSLRLNVAYYLNGQLVPALNRIFGLLGHDVRNWYLSSATDNTGGRRPTWYASGTGGALSRYLTVEVCVACRQASPVRLCTSCRTTHRAATAVTIADRLRRMQMALTAVMRVCGSCQALTLPEPLRCQSTDCPLYFRHYALNTDALMLHEGLAQLCLL